MILYASYFCSSTHFCLQTVDTSGFAQYKTRFTTYGNKGFAGSKFLKKFFYFIFWDFRHFSPFLGTKNSAKCLFPKDFCKFSEVIFSQKIFILFFIKILLFSNDFTIFQQNRSLNNLIFLARYRSYL